MHFFSINSLLPTIFKLLFGTSTYVKDVNTPTKPCNIQNQYSEDKISNIQQRNSCSIEFNSSIYAQTCLYGFYNKKSFIFTSFVLL